MNRISWLKKKSVVPICIFHYKRLSVFGKAILISFSFISFLGWLRHSFIRWPVIYYFSDLSNHFHEFHVNDPNPWFGTTGLAVPRRGHKSIEPDSKNFSTGRSVYSKLSIRHLIDLVTWGRNRYWISLKYWVINKLWIQQCTLHDLCQSAFRSCVTFCVILISHLLPKLTELCVHT